MKIHEYQAKAILARYGVPVPEGHVADSPAEVLAQARRLGRGPWVVKAQIHAGGRGKGGGIRVCQTEPELEQAARAILGMQLVTHQTGPEGQRVQKVLVERGCAIERELYLGMVVDRQREAPVVMASAQGGMDIEEVAHASPEAILFESIDPAAGALQPFQGRILAERLGLVGADINAFASLAVGFSRMFLAEDCSLAEINPLVRTLDGQWLALDAKVTFDDNALYRQRDNAGLRDPAEEDEREALAAAHQLSYISMDGDIGCMVNGAGLAMATMDIIKLHGGAPANFLDVGGGATQERVAEAFRIILSDPNVRAILINIFGGIVRCDTIAHGIIEAARGMHLEVPLVVRLEGNKVEEGRRLLAATSMNIIPAADLEDAARQAVVAARGGAA